MWSLWSSDAHGERLEWHSIFGVRSKWIFFFYLLFIHLVDKTVKSLGNFLSFLVFRFQLFQVHGRKNALSTSYTTTFLFFCCCFRIVWQSNFSQNRMLCGGACYAFIVILSIIIKPGTHFCDLRALMRCTQFVVERNSVAASHTYRFPWVFVISACDRFFSIEKFSIFNSCGVWSHLA